MVDITTVYDEEQKRILYVYVNEEYLVIATYDYVRNEIPDGLDYDQLITVELDRKYFTTDPSYDNHQMNCLADEIVQLLLGCELSFIRHYCEHTKDSYYTTVTALPNELYKQLTNDYVKWLDSNNQLVKTDGYKIIVDERYYKSLTGDTPNAVAAKALQQHLDECMPTVDIDTDEKPWNDFYHEKLQIIYCGKLFTFENGADVYNALDELAKFIIDQQ